MFAVLAASRLAPGVVRLVVRAPGPARNSQAGQFAVVRMAEGAERVPLTIADRDAAAGTVTLIVREAGSSTAALCALRPGDEIRDLLGPLGRPTSIDHYGAVACVAGGVGAAVMWPIARALKAAGNAVYTILGARTKELLILERELAAASRELLVLTEDGSHGRRGTVADALGGVLARPPHIPVVFTAGPLEMMRAVAEITRPLDVFTYASLKPVMVDGTGLCGGCRVTVDGLTRLACVDGPEFDAHGLDFDELLRRAGTYAPHECEARAGGADRPA